MYDQGDGAYRFHEGVKPSQYSGKKTVHGDEEGAEMEADKKLLASGVDLYSGPHVVAIQCVH